MDSIIIISVKALIPMVLSHSRRVYTHGQFELIYFEDTFRRYQSAAIAISQNLID